MTRKTIRLVHITTVPYALFYFSGQVGYMKARGFEVYALSSPGNLLSVFSEKEGIQVKAIKMLRRLTPCRDFVALFKIWRWLRGLRPEIVHAHTPKGGLLGMFGAWLVRAPVRIYHVHGLRFVTATGWRRRLLISSEKWSCRLAHQVLCVSASVRTLALEAGLCPAEKIKVLLHGSCNGVDSKDRFNPSKVAASTRGDSRAKYRIPNDALVLGFVGRIVWSKGIVELAQAWSDLRDEFPDLHLLMAGPIEPEDPLPTEVEELLRRDQRVHLIGEDWDTPPLYAAMDVFVLPTYREGLPIVLLEAAAMNLPVVATRVSGCVDVVADGITGILVPPCDSRELAGAIRSYLKDPQLRRQHGSAAREHVIREFNQENIWLAMYQEYAGCLSRKELAPPVSEPAPGIPPSGLAGLPAGKAGR
jgi:glycosyltransferase involved in cell wall biosynthesis